MILMHAKVWKPWLYLFSAAQETKAKMSKQILDSFGGRGVWEGGEEEFHDELIVSGMLAFLQPNKTMFIACFTAGLIP